MASYRVIRPGGFSWYDRFFEEGQVITSSDLNFPLRERQLVTGNYLTLCDEPGEMTEDAGEAPVAAMTGSGETMPVRRRGRPAGRSNRRG